ncbi:MAG: type VI secretion system tube protein Hcp [Pseudomonadota bacterium]
MTIYMQHGEVYGASKEDDHVGWSSVLSLTVGMDNHGGQSIETFLSTGQQYQKVFRPYEVVRIADESTPLLIRQFDNAQFSPEVRFKCLGNGEDGNEYTVYEFTFKEVTIRSIDLDFEHDRYIERMMCMYRQLIVKHPQTGNVGDSTNPN